MQCSPFWLGLGLGLELGLGFIGKRGTQDPGNVGSGEHRHTPLEISFLTVSAETVNWNHGALADAESLKNIQNKPEEAQQRKAQIAQL